MRRHEINRLLSLFRGLSDADCLEPERDCGGAWLGSSGERCFRHGDTPGLADVGLVPQLFNARRFDCALLAHATLPRIDAACEALSAFRDAALDM